MKNQWSGGAVGVTTVVKAKRKHWVVQITLHVRDRYHSPMPERSDIIRTQRDSLWLAELLRYAGITSVVSVVGDEEVYNLFCPKGYSEAEWAQQNADRMRSFGVDATARQV